MIFNNNGEMMFNDKYELNYEVLNELNLQRRSDGTVFDPESNTVFYMNGYKLICSIRPDEIMYPSEDQLEFDLISNYKLVQFLFGWYYKKFGNLEDKPYFDEYTTINELKYSRLCIKVNDEFTLCTNYYHLRCLKYVEMIFLLDNENVDLSNLDILDDEELK